MYRWKLILNLCFAIHYYILIAIQNLNMHSFVCVLYSLNICPPLLSVAIKSTQILRCNTHLHCLFCECLVEEKAPCQFTTSLAYGGNLFLHAGEILQIDCRWLWVAKSSACLSPIILLVTYVWTWIFWSTAVHQTCKLGAKRCAIHLNIKYIWVV